MNGGGGVWSAWVAAQPALVVLGFGVLGGGRGDDWWWRCVGCPDGAQSGQLGALVPYHRQADRPDTLGSPE